jgi:hypothetical protein
VKSFFDAEGMTISGTRALQWHPSGIVL